jgi:hypothetical protein
VLWLCPTPPILLDGFFWNRAKRRVGSQLKEIGSGPFEGDFELVVPDGFHADVFDLAPVVSLRIADEEEHRSVWGSGLWVENSFPGVDEVMGRDRPAIAPSSIFDQIECELCATCVGFPFLGERRCGLGRIGVILRQPFKKVNEDLVFRAALGQMWVEGLGAGPQADSDVTC